MNESPGEDIEIQLRLAELNFKKEVKEAKQKKHSKLLALSDSSGKSQISEFGSTTLSSIGSSLPGQQLSDASFSTSFIRLEDVELPSFSNVTSGEEILHISDGSSTPNQSILKKAKEKILKAVNLSLAEPPLEHNPSTPLNHEERKGSNSASISGNSSAVFAEYEKVLQELETNSELMSPNDRLTILDLERLNHSLIIGTPKTKVQDNKNGPMSYPKMSTPKADQQTPPDCTDLTTDKKTNLSPGTNIAGFNETFEETQSFKVSVENTFVINEELTHAKETVEGRLKTQKKSTLQLNSTFDKKEMPYLMGNVLSCHTEETQPNPDKGKDAKEMDSTFTTNEKVANSTFVQKTKVVNTTFDAQPVQGKILNNTYDKTEKVTGLACQKALNSTFDAQKENEEEGHNRTFEVIGNGSFIIEGKSTNLMDMESNDLDTVLTCTPMKDTVKNDCQNTPRTSLSRHTTRDARRSSLLKRLSLVGLQSKPTFNLDTTTECTDRQSPTELQSENKENAPNLPKFETHPSLGLQTKEDGQFRLKKRSAQPITAGNGPMKAVPLPKAIESLSRRATSTPISLPNSKISAVQKIEKNCDSVDSDKKEEKLPLPSFGSVSSIESNCPNSLERMNAGVASTPDVFRARERNNSPRITSTPAMGRGPKFESDLGLGTAPTPIVAPSSKENFRTLHHSSSPEQDKNGVERLCFSQESSKEEAKDPQHPTSSPDSNEDLIVAVNIQRGSSDKLGEQIKEPEDIKTSKEETEKTEDIKMMENETNVIEDIKKSNNALCDSVKEENKDSNKLGASHELGKTSPKSEDTKEMKTPANDNSEEQSFSVRKELSTSKSDRLSANKSVTDSSKGIANRRSESFRSSISKTENTSQKSFNRSFTTRKGRTPTTEERKVHNKQESTFVKDSVSSDKKRHSSNGDVKILNKGSSRSSVNQTYSKVSKPRNDLPRMKPMPSSVNSQESKNLPAADTCQPQKSGLVAPYHRKRNLVRPALKPINTGNTNPSNKGNELVKKSATSGSHLAAKATENKLVHRKIPPPGKIAVKYLKSKGVGVKSGSAEELAVGGTIPAKPSSRYGVQPSRVLNRPSSTNKENSKGLLPQKKVGSTIKPRSAIPMRPTFRK